MFSQFRTRAETRALIGALLVGASLGLAASAAYFIDLHARMAADEARVARLTNAALAGYAASSTTPSPTPAAVTPSAPSANVAAEAPRLAQTSVTRTSGDLDCLATAVYYEARGETVAGQAAVAQVVLNRAHRPSWPKSVCAVVYQSVGHDCQFSFVCNGAMRHGREPQAWARARDVAARALNGYVMTAVGQATAFHAAHGDASTYAKGAIRLGGHVFYVASAGTSAPRFSARRIQASSRSTETDQPRLTFALGVLTPVGAAAKDAAATTVVASQSGASTPS